MRINGTILGVAPIATSLLVVGSFLTILFTVMKPEVSQGLSFIPRFIFWMLQVGTALIGIVLASYVIRLISQKTFPLWIAVGVTGLVGAVISTPAFLLIDYFFPGLEDLTDDWLDDFEKLGWWQALVSEFVEILPNFLAAWYLVNIPLFINNTTLNRPPPEDPNGEEQDEHELKRRSIRDAFFDGLPDAVGNDLIVISSDLHYLNVYTSLGKCVVLGSLSQVADALDNQGFLIHRSHWVAKPHVARVHISGNTAYCVMSNEMQVPVSRSKRKLVKEYFGQSKLDKKGAHITPIKSTAGR